MVVTITYRLASLGFLAHPALTAENGAAPTNFAMLDQQAAMRWVKNNIQSFSGNPDNVTIGGESGGSISLAVHQISPLATGLFHRALQISGGPIRKGVPLRDAETEGLEDAGSLGCPGSCRHTGLLAHAAFCHGARRHDASFREVLVASH